MVLLSTEVAVTNNNALLVQEKSIVGKETGVEKGVKQNHPVKAMAAAVVVLTLG